MNCNTCGSEVFGDSVFCDSCGAIIGSTPQAPPPQTDASSFEPTQLISVHDEAPAAPTPPTPSTPPVAPAPPAAQVSRPSAHPPAPARSSGPVYATQPKRSAIPLVGGVLVFVGLVVLAFLIGGAFGSDSDPVDEVSGDSGVVGEDSGDESSDSDDPGEDGEISPDETLPGAAAVEVPEGFVLYEGACFAAAIPDSWMVTEDSGERSYGRRTAWSRGDEELFVDTSPLRDATVTGKEAADEQLNNRSTATSGLIEEAGRDDMWSYTYTRSGTPSIAIYFVEERGFGIVGSSRTNPDGVMAEARRVSASIQVTDPTC